MSIEILTNSYLLLFVFTSCIFYLYLHWISNYWKRRGVNGPKSYPFIGTLWEHFSQPICELEVQRYQKYGRIYGTMLGWVPMLTIGEPELIKQITITDFRYFTNHRTMFPLDSVFGTNLVNLKDNEWKIVRSIVTPVFSTGKLKAMQPLINRCIQNTMKYIENIAKEGIEVDSKKVMMSYTMETICSCAFGIQTNGNKNMNNEFVRKAEEMVNFRLWRLITSLILPESLQYNLNLSLIDENLMTYFAKALTVAIEDRKRQNSDSKDFVKLLLDAELNKDSKDFSQSSESKRKLSDNEIIAQCLLFFTAGYETTSALLQFTLYAMAMNPKVQQTLFDEIRNYFKDHETEEYDSLLSLPYLDAVINESLRLYSPVPMFELMCGGDYELGDTGIVIEKGTVINMPTYAIHHDPQFYPEPEKFNPERFLPENRESIVQYSFVPFGSGPRMCVGVRFAMLSAKLFLANFVNLFEVITTRNTTPKPEFTGVLTQLSCKPLFVSFKKR